MPVLVAVMEVLATAASVIAGILSVLAAVKGLFSAVGEHQAGQVGAHIAPTFLGVRMGYFVIVAVLGALWLAFDS